MATQFMNQESLTPIQSSEAQRSDQDSLHPLTPPTEPSAQVAGAPRLNVTLESVPTVSLNASRLNVLVKVTYNAQEARPIVFHAFGFEGQQFWHDGFRLYRYRNNMWERHEEDVDDAFLVVDDPDVPVNVGQDEHFVGLGPGDSWTSHHSLPLPSDLVVGEFLRYQYKGGRVDWWDWGTKEEHQNTIVKLPCWIMGWVVDPKDNDGRPVLVVPASNTLQLTVVP